MTHWGVRGSSPPVAQHASALKRHRQSEKRRLRNKATKTKLRHIVRVTRDAVDKREGASATSALAQATKALDKAATKGAIHRNTAARRISRLTRAVHAAKG